MCFDGIEIELRILRSFDFPIFKFLDLCGLTPLSLWDAVCAS